MSLLSLLISLALVGAVASTGARFRPDGWYRSLAKPCWTPPDLAFPIAWGVLYVLMAIAAWRVYLAEPSAARSAGLICYALQLAANAAWSWLFFGRRQMFSALLDIALLLGLIVATTALFARASELAAWLMLPYILWVMLALALNASVWRLNRHA
ncbi:TspO/MBR family protein [Vreelandella subglaciescola]|jgi:tryptophan-rich sensory protein|uniref:TspO and MBR related proteins n=1 Tax=Vreelandella subglaciescola TaxID=29571 RepID=A0A1M7HJM7_9GAMM|nr:TspO/MBR family protein [Halomonas subglaciescola]SHM28712.1 TspO and MBR related proteins [Halomonas subglaciescola]